MRRSVLVLVATLAAASGTARASRFQVQPTRVDLAGVHQVGSLTVTNRSGDAVRFQVTAMAWSEREDGTTALAPTEDVVVYPSLFTLAAGDSRAVRVTSTATPGAHEVPYRVFVEELPPLRTPGAPAATRITMLTRMGIPVFLPATSERVAGEVTATVDGAGVELRLVNRGSVHVRVTSIRVIGDAHGAIAFDRSQAGWYLLPGGARRYRLPLTAQERARVDRVRVEVVTDRATWTTSVAVVPGLAAR